jgi:DNA-binding transcriptional LysR family regulator
LLRTLLHVADTASMTVAARRLHMTQGAVSQQIKRLEELLGQVLLVRGKGGARLTAQGERLLPQARQLVEFNDGMVVAMRPQELTGQVRLGVPHDLIGTHLPPILQAFTTQFPLVDIRLVTGSSMELKQLFGTGAVDLAMSEEMAGSHAGEILAIEQPVWVGKAGGEAWRQRPLPVCLVSASCIFRQPMSAALAAAGIAWRNMIHYPNVQATVALVEQDRAVTVLLPSTIPAHLLPLTDAAGLPPPLASLPSLPPFAVTLLAPAQGATAACHALADALRSAY